MIFCYIFDLVGWRCAHTSYWYVKVFRNAVKGLHWGVGVIDLLGVFFSWKWIYIFLDWISGQWCLDLRSRSCWVRGIYVFIFWCFARWWGDEWWFVGRKIDRNEGKTSKSIHCRARAPTQNPDRNQMNNCATAIVKGTAWVQAKDLAMSYWLSSTFFAYFFKN